MNEHKPPRFSVVVVTYGFMAPRILLDNMSCRRLEEKSQQLQGRRIVQNSTV